MTALHTILRTIDALGPPFRVSTEPPANITSEDTEVDWFHSGQLCDPDTGEVRRLVELHARFRDMPVGRHAGSLVFQRYCHRVCGVSVAAWVLHGVALDLRATSVRVRLADGTPDLLVLGRPTVQPGATAEDVLDTTFDGHLLPVARALRSVTGPGLGNLLGNIAAGFAGGFRTLTHRSPACLDVHEVRERAEELLSARPELRRGGDLRVLIGPSAPVSSTTAHRAATGMQPPTAVTALGVLGSPEKKEPSGSRKQWPKSSAADQKSCEVIRQVRVPVVQGPDHTDVCRYRNSSRSIPDRSHDGQHRGGAGASSSGKVPVSGQPRTHRGRDALEVVDLMRVGQGQRARMNKEVVGKYDPGIFGKSGDEILGTADDRDLRSVGPACSRSQRMFPPT